VSLAGIAAATVSLTLTEVEELPPVHTRVNILDLQKECGGRRRGFGGGPTAAPAMLATPQRHGTRHGGGAATG